MLAGVRYDVARTPFVVRLDVRMAPKHHPTPLSAAKRAQQYGQRGDVRHVSWGSTDMYSPSGP
jgi:hypothetical protein